MKKNLLLLGAALLMTASAMAQSFTRTYTRPSAPNSVSAASYNYAAAEGGDALYLWNVKYGGFYTNVHKGGNGFWGTRAAASDTIGAKVYFTHENPQNAEADASAEWVDANGKTAYLFVSYVDWEGKNADMCSFADNWAGIYTDWNNQTNRYWLIKENGDYLNFSIAKVNEVEVEWDLYNLCVRAPEKDADKLVYLNMPEVKEMQENPETGEMEEVVVQAGFTEPEDVGEDWAIVTPTEYESYIEVAGPMLRLYAAAQALRGEVEKYTNNTTDYPGISSYFSDQYAAYNASDATVESLNEARAAISDIVKEFQEGRATPDNPVNYTAGLTNPNFEEGTTGWTGIGAVNYSCAETFNVTPFDVYQVVTNLPQGVYRISNQAFYRAGGHGAGPEYERYTADPTADRNAMLYGRSKDYGEVAVKIKRAIDEAQPTAVNSDDSALPGTVTLSDGTNTWEGNYIPNTMAGARAWFDKDHYQNSLFLGVSGREDELTIGFKKNVGIENDWCIYDNFELWYYGSTLEAYQLWGNEVKKTVPDYDWDNIYCGAPEKEAFLTLKNNLSSAGTIEDITAAISGINEAQENLEASIQVYADFVAQVDGFDQWLTDNGVDQNTPEAERLGVYMKEVVEPNDPEMAFPNGSAAYILDINGGATAGTLSAAEMEAELEFINEMKVAAQSAGFQKGSSLTYLIKNPTFTGRSGSRDNYTVPNWSGSKLTDVQSPQCEFWNRGSFDFYQDIDDEVIKPGLYSVSVQAYYRPGNTTNAWNWYLEDPECVGVAKVHTSVYMNEFATPIKNVMEITYPTNLANNCSSHTTTAGETVYALNGMASARVAFAYPEEERNFTMHVYGLVTEEEAGHIRLGIKKSVAQSEDWTLFGNFQITYQAKDAAGLKEVIEDYLERDNNLDYVSICSEDLDAWNLAMSATSGYKSKPADANGDNAELYDMAVNLAKAYNVCEESAKIIEQLNTALTELEDYLSDHADEIDPDVYTEIDDWTLQVREEMDPDGTGSMSPDGSSAKFAQYIQDCKDKLQQAKESGIDWDEVPVDLTKFIENPNYDNAGTGWTEEGTVNAHNSRLAESYQGTFDTYQTVVLPKDGYYRLSVRGFERLGWAAGDYAIYEAGTWPQNTGAYLYAKVGDAIYSHHIKQLATGAVTTEEQSKFSGNWQTVGNDLHVTDNMAGASSFMYYYQDQTRFPENFVENEQGELVVKDPTAGYYFNEVFFNAPAGEAIIGLTKPERKVSGGDWCIWGDWQLWYFGTELPVGINDIQNDNAIAAPVQRSIYTLGGAKLQQMQRGINIVRTVDADGNVKVQKVFVK